MDVDRTARPRGPHTTREGLFVDEPPDPDHPCSTSALGLVADPPGWTRRTKAARCPGPGKAPDRIPLDAGVVDVRPNVRRDVRERGCRTLFRSWSIRSHADGCVVAEVQDVWILGARFHVNQTELARARRGREVKGRATREKNVNSWVYGFAMPSGSIVPDPSSALVIGYDPWSVVHPGFFEVAPGEYRARQGRDVRDDRFDLGEQYAAAHLWIDPATRSPRIVVYRRLLSVDATALPNPSRVLNMVTRKQPRESATKRRNSSCGCSNPMPGRGTFPAPKRRAAPSKKKASTRLEDTEQTEHSYRMRLRDVQPWGGPFLPFASKIAAERARAQWHAMGAAYGFSFIRRLTDAIGRGLGYVLEISPVPGVESFESVGLGETGSPRVVGPEGHVSRYELTEQEYLLRPVEDPDYIAPPAPRYQYPAGTGAAREQMRLFNPARGARPRGAIVQLTAAESAAIARGDRALARRVLAAARGLALRERVAVAVRASHGATLLRVRSPR